MKLIIQIPCYNEETSLPIAYAALPRTLAGIDEIETLIVDDGSSDRTVEVARDLGVNHIVRHTRNKGLAAAFMSGINEAIQQGADIIVNTDADNQYNADDIPFLIKPILEGSADIVIGTRPISSIEHFSPIKKALQHLGSLVVRLVSHTDVVDAPSGFRAFSRRAAQQLFVFNEYTYTLETIIQAGMKNMAITAVPIRVNEDLRPSKLVKSIPSYIKKSVITIVRILVIYKPFRFFLGLGSVISFFGVLIGVRFLFYLMTGSGAGHTQSLILASILILMGFQCIITAFLADLLSANRKLLEGIKSDQYALIDKERGRF